MKKLFLLLIPFLFIGCSMEPSIFKIINESDFTVEIKQNENIFISNAKSEMEIDGSVYDNFELNGIYPAKLSRSNTVIRITNNYTASKLHVKNDTSEKIDFEITNCYYINNIHMEPNGILDLDIIVFNNTPSILNSNYNFYTFNKIDGEYYLIFN